MKLLTESERQESKLKDRARRKIWWKTNREKARIYSLRYRTENPESGKRAKLKHYLSHQKAILEKRRQYTRNNPDKVRAAELKYRQNNREKFRIKSSRYYHNNLEKMRVFHSQAYYRRKARLLKCTFDRTADIFISKIRAMESVPCYYCGEVVSGKSAHIDHIVAISKNGNHSSENLCASCCQCNIRKGAKSVSEWKTSGQQIFNI